MAEHRACHGCLDGCTRETAVHCVSCVNEPWPCDASVLGRQQIQVTIRGAYGRGPMPIEFAEAMGEMIRLVKQGIDDGTLP